MKTVDKYLAIGITILTLSICLAFACIPQYPPHQWAHLEGPGLAWGLYKIQYTLGFKILCSSILLGATILLWRERHHWSFKQIQRPLVHGGIWLLALSLFFGNIYKDTYRCQINTHSRTPSYFDEHLRSAHLPFQIQLLRCTPDQVEVMIQSQYHWFEHFTLSANKPLYIEAYEIYLIHTNAQDQAILQIIDDPLGFLAQSALWILLIGLCMAAWAHLKGFPRLYLYLFGATALCFIAIQSPLLITPIQQRVPILRSPWLLPHIIAYMLGYALMSLSFVDSLIRMIRSKSNLPLAARSSLSQLGVVFLGLGCVLGSLWAKEAYGSYWSWDPKEAWALLCISIYTIANHLPKLSAKAHFRWQTLGFICLQMCWWGLNYLHWMPNGWHQY